MIIVALTSEKFGVYAANGRFDVGPFGTPLLFKGSLDECLEFRRS